MAFNADPLLAPIANAARSVKAGTRTLKLTDGGAIRRLRWSSVAQVLRRRSGDQLADAVLRPRATGVGRTLNRSNLRSHAGAWCGGALAWRRRVVRGAIASLTGAFMMACSGCGGGGGEDVAGQPSANPPIEDLRTVIIDCEGDSTMWGMAKDQHGNPYQTARSAPTVLQERLDLMLDDIVVVNNNGVPSASVADSLSGDNQYYAVRWETRAATSKAKIVIGNYALNDMKSVSPEQFYLNLAEWVHRTRVAGKVPILEEPNPITRPGLPDVEPYVRVIGRVAEDNNVALVKQYDYIKSLPNWQVMLPDGVHPSDELYEIKARRAADVIVPIVYSLIPQP